MMKKYQIKQKAIFLLKNKFPNKEILLIKKNHIGYTNYSFFVVLNDKTKWQVRIPHCGKIIDRQCEQKILNLLKINDYVYFDIKTGESIKKWIDGAMPKKDILKNKNFLSNLFDNIKNIHKLKFDNKKYFKKINFNQYLKYFPFLKEKYKKLFLFCLKNRSNDKLFVNHSDINLANMLITQNKKIYLIDYEWVCLASDYWDYANFIRETYLDYEKINWANYINNFDIKVLQQYIFLSCIYAFLWTYHMPKSLKIHKYRHKVLKQIKYYYHKIFINETI